MLHTTLTSRAVRKTLAGLGLAAALGLGLAAAVPAAPAQAPQARSQQYMRGIEKLHADLKLNAEQEALWQKAQAQAQDTFRAGREQRAQQRQELRAALDQPNADLRAVAAQMDKMRDQQAANRRQVRDAWLTVYDALNPPQKEQVRVFLKDRMARGDQWRAKMHERWEQRGQRGR